MSVYFSRADNNLQDIRAKIFPYRRRKVQAPEVMHSVSLPAKRKERSLSSLVVSTPKVPLQTGLTGKRTKGSARKAAALRGCGFFIEDKKEDSAEDCPMSSSSPDSLSKISQNKRQVRETELWFSKLPLALIIHIYFISSYSSFN